MPKIGFHLGNRGNPWEPQQRLFKETNAGILLAMEPVTPESIKSWATNNSNNILVLRKHFAPDGQASKNDVMNWSNGQIEMAHRYLAHSEFQHIYEKGNLFIKIFNEPNFGFEGFGRGSDSMKLYNELYILAAQEINRALPKAKRVGYSLAPGNDDVYFQGDTQNSHYYFHGPEASKDNPSDSEIIAASQSCLTREAQSYMDVLGIHVYPHPNTWDKPWLGKRFEQYWKFLPKHLVNNTYILEASVADSAGQQERAVQTYKWLEMLRGFPQIKGITLWWLRPGDGTWENHFYTNPDESPRPVYHSVINFINDYGQPEDTQPIPEPEPEPPENTDREVINPPTWDSFSIIEADVDPGKEYWKLTRFKMLTEEESNGKHYIEILEPHTDKTSVRVKNTGNNETQILPLDTKPDNEPAQIIIMWAHTDGNEYNIDLTNLPSDKVTGLRMEGNRHIVFQLTYKKVKKESDSMDIIWFPSPNFNNRPPVPIDSIVLHATVGNLENSLDWLSNPDSRVSTHYLIGKDGTTYQMVEEHMRAWHAGDSSYLGKVDWNDFSIGIELVNANDGVDPYPQEQIESLIKLCRDLVSRHPIQRKYIASHAEVAYPKGRKSDPLGLDLSMIKDKVFSDFNSFVIEMGEQNIAIEFNPNAALQKVIFDDGFVPNSNEFLFPHNGINYVGQRAENLSSGQVRVYYAIIGKWGQVDYVTKQ